MTPEEEAERATELLRGKDVKRVVRHRTCEILVEFDDGSRLYAAHPIADNYSRRRFPRIFRN